MSWKNLPCLTKISLKIRAFQLLYQAPSLNMGMHMVSQLHKCLHEPKLCVVHLSLYHFESPKTGVLRFIKFNPPFDSKPHFFAAVFLFQIKEYIPAD